MFNLFNALNPLLALLPCLIFEDEHLLVANKPAGLNTHAPSPYAGEGLYEWLRHREARWARLAIIHRLDKETSGVMVFAKTPLANRSLTAQFAAREVRKRYFLLTDRPVHQSECIIRTSLVRAGPRYVSRPLHAGGETAETRFRLCRRPVLRSSTAEGGQNAEGRSGDPNRMLEAEPWTGRTHQVRVHAAEMGFPILGDALYGGTPAARVYLHAAELTLQHPASGQELTFWAPTGPDWANIPMPATAETGEGCPRHTGPLPCLDLRAALISPEDTDVYRVIHGASDGWPDWYVERLGPFLLSQSTEVLSAAQREQLRHLTELFSARGAYHKILARRVQRVGRAQASPHHVLGEAAPERFTVQENGVQFELSFNEGYSIGLFLDQRDNRRRLLTRHIAAEFPLCQLAIGNRQLEILNVFAYTCGFSVCAAKAGARTTSVDLSKRWLDWGQRNFALNGLDSAGHEFIYGDALDWLRPLAKKRRCFDLILLDPPTFSQSKALGVFRAEKDYGGLIGAALPLLRSGGVLFASTNAAAWPPGNFLAEVDNAIAKAKRRVLQRHYVPQPPDFPISRAEPGYLKTIWLRVE